MGLNPENRLEVICNTIFPAIFNGYKEQRFWTYGEAMDKIEEKYQIGLNLKEQITDEKIKNQLGVQLENCYNKYLKVMKNNEDQIKNLYV